jgi:hypothetical protein
LTARGDASRDAEPRRRRGFTGIPEQPEYALGETTADVQALIGAAPSFAGPGFLVPMRSASLMRWCLQHGLRIVQPMTLMTMGPYDEPKGAFLASVLY